MPPTPRKIALIHDHLAQDGGAERVLQIFQQMWPEAPTYVLVYDPKHASSAFNGKDIRTSFIQRLPLGVKKYQWFFPFMPSAVESYDLSQYDLIISSSSSYAKGVISNPDALHICYCHSPTRYLWSDTHSYVRELGVPRVIKWILPSMLSLVRMWDKMAAERVDSYIANSQLVKRRIKKYYNADSTVIYPPVNVQEFPVGQGTGDYFLAGGRLVPYKRFDLLVQAFNQLGRKLIIYGDGPAAEELKKQAHPNITFLGRVSEDKKKELLRDCIAFLNPQEEDFGITMVEAHAAGRPVIAYTGGGAAEIVLPGVTGELFDEQTWEDVADAVLRFSPMKYNQTRIRERAMEFDVERFKREMFTFVEQQLKLHTHVWN